MNKWIKFYKNIILLNFRYIKEYDFYAGYWYDISIHHLEFVYKESPIKPWEDRTSKIGIPKYPLQISSEILYKINYILNKNYNLSFSYPNRKQVYGCINYAFKDFWIYENDIYYEYCNGSISSIFEGDKGTYRTLLLIYDPNNL